MKAFEDHFSRRAQLYARHRPTYPKELYSYLASLSPDHRLAWDCGTGNGQAAAGLSNHFDRVIASDASAEQLAQAPAHDRVEFRVARAEESGLASNSVGLVTSAVAVHWFELDRFYAEVRRVSVPHGIIAVWCYSLLAIDPGVDAIVRRYFNETLGGYWPQRFHYIREEYGTLPFPFKEIAPPKFTMGTVWELADVLGFLSSWSGAAEYEKHNGRNPLDLIRQGLTEAWGGESNRTVTWKLHLRVGRIE